MYVKQFRRRAVSAILSAAILLQAAPVFLPEAQALDIEVYVKNSDGNEVLRGYIVQNQEFNCYDGPLYAVDPCDDPSGMRSARTADSAPQEGENGQQSAAEPIGEIADEPASDAANEGARDAATQNADERASAAPATNAADAYSVAIEMTGMGRGVQTRRLNTVLHTSHFYCYRRSQFHSFYHQLGCALFLTIPV